MSLALKEQLAVCGIALFNGVFIYPYIKKFYRHMYQVKAAPTHYVYFDVDIDGKDVGRLNIELFGNEAPKTVNNFLAFCSGDFSPYMRYRDTFIHKVVPGKFIKGGDFMNQDGTGSATVYDTSTIDSEKNKLKFVEPYLLAIAPNKEGQVGSQFFITLDSLPSLDGSDCTIFGRLISGRDTVHMIEGIDEFRKLKAQLERNTEDVKKCKIYVKNAGVYKFDTPRRDMQRQSAAGRLDFKPEDFYESRRNQMNVAIGKQSNAISNVAKRGLMMLRSATKDVELNGFKITAVDDEDSKNNMIFLHGLLGQGRNWRSFALNDIISAKRNVYLVDLRNHGESDHHQSMTYQEMADDVMRYADSKQIDKFSILGHNLGAKTAMTLACHYPDRVSSLISIDTAPKSVLGDKSVVKQTVESIQKIKSLNIEGKTRKTAIDVIQQSFKDPGIANFVASNLVYDEASDRKFVKWCVNLDSILMNYEHIIGFDDKMKPYTGPTLFLNGSLSVKHNDSVYQKLFPNCQIENVEGAGHYVHTDKPKIAVQSIAKFLDLAVKNK